MFAPSEDSPFPFSCQPYFLISPTQVCLLGGAKEVCPTDLYTHSGECCKACNLGEGVAQPCGANQTVCEPCLDSEYRMGGGGGGESRGLGRSMPSGGLTSAPPPGRVSCPPLYGYQKWV